MFIRIGYKAVEITTKSLKTGIKTASNTMQKHLELHQTQYH